MYYEPHIRKLITQTLMDFNPALCTLPAIELLILTGAHESRFGTYLYQLHGPALGFFQIEPDTHNSIFQNYFYRRYPMFRQKDHAELASDLRYQIIVARGIYADKTEAIPNQDDIPGMAAYYKAHWNTIKGAATIPDVIKHYRQFVKGES